MLARLASYNLSALALLRPRALPLSASLTLLVLHTFGLVLVAQLMRAPLWIVIAAALIVAVAQAAPRARPIISPAILAPFWIVYAFVLLRFLWLRVWHGEIEGYFEYTLPDLRVLLHFEFLGVAALLYGVLILVSLLLESRAKALTLSAVILAGAVLLWAGVVYLGHRTFGATGSDPFAYVQMGVDMATRGTASHLFRVFPLISNTSLSWFPVLHVGYHLPYDLEGNAITVWSIAGSFLYSLAYRIGGEQAMYFVNPIFSVVSALVSGLLAWELARNLSHTPRLVIAGATTGLIATSNEIVNWAGATMVDTQALVYSALAFYCGLRVLRTGKWSWAIGAGVCWGMAYFVRHTQFLIALSFVPLFLLSPFPTRMRLRNLSCTLLAALVIALPDLWYHQTYLGNWLHPESEELALFALDAIPATLGAIGQSALTGAEFGWLPPFIVLGIVFYTRHEKITGTALLLWLGAALAIHLPYAALRLRDLIPEFPIPAFYAIYGVVTTIVKLWKQQRAWATLTAGLVIFLGLELGLVRVWNTLPRAAQAARPNFGTMTANQRSSFEVLSQTLPPDALVGASLNSGAIDLYSKREAFRPADWSSDELRKFVATAQEKGYDIYLLQDNATMTGVLDDLRQRYRLERISTLDVPLFGDQTDPDAGALWKILR